MGSIRQLKRSKAASAVSPLNPSLMEAWNRGFNEGVKQQREKDIESTVTMLEGLENIPGIGEKTAWKVREHVIKKFGAQS